ncbi:MAG: tRNA (adenosine(37)-N6)-dimethylallyltransferase MiaA [Halobacteriovoraceae bacterium]|nr:tRNA (adenosine(37)-N6)-dimethylallyltransferase MiaA [Halobacteriovoraceae bacterium]|tara:strand:- start:13913 stop:14857 length:945 start_codon:yes stop_codon:yes gene_type:complete
MKTKIIVVSGPTATGKTDMSIRLAKKYNASIINFDSLLFYREISIGTAKPSLQERKEIPHYMIDSHSIFNPINAADYFQQTIPLIIELSKKSDNPIILVGGSGFYLQTILKGMFDSKTSPDHVVEKSNKLYQQEGILPFLEILKAHDQASYERYHENDHYRIRRAVEHWWSTKTPFSESREQMELKKQTAPPIVYGWDILHLHLDVNKELHWDIIQRRTSKMLENGIVEEVKGLLQQGATGNEKPLKSIGYLEVFKYLNGEINDLDGLQERINISTRQLAKAQRTWFKKVEKMSYNPLEDWDKIESQVQEFLTL